MKFLRVVLPVLVVFSLLVSGCNSSVPAKEQNTLPTSAPTASILPTSIPTVISGEQAPNTVSVKVVPKRPLSLQKKSTIFLKGVATGSEYVEFVIKGKIFDLKQIELAWDEKSNVIVEKRVVKTISRLNNQVVVIKTVEPEGIPIEKVTWKSETGKKYEYVISYNGVEGSSKYFIIN